MFGGKKDFCAFLIVCFVPSLLEQRLKCFFHPSVFNDRLSHEKKVEFMFNYVPFSSHIRV